MKNVAVLSFAMMLAACATVPEAQRTGRLFNDHLFAPASEPISVDAVFALSAAMKHYLNVTIADQLRAKGRQQGLIDALYRKDQLKLEYDSGITRNASQAFEARSGNCLSLVIMTAAFAKEAGLTVRYQKVLLDEVWSRGGGIYFSSGHVNLTLGKNDTGNRTLFEDRTPITIDFLPPDANRGPYLRPIGEETIVAMYMNNRAAESLLRGQLNDAYWWAREAIRQDPGFLSSYNTLGIVYRRHGDLQAAEQALALALEHEPGNSQFMSNLALVLSDQGRLAEANLLIHKLEQMNPHPPFHYFNLGISAMQVRDFHAAKALFAKEVERDPSYHEFHFWLGVAHFSLGEVKQASTHLTFAMDNSTTRNEHDLYAAKLDRIRSYLRQ